MWLTAGLKFETCQTSVFNVSFVATLADFATALDMECEHAIIFAFVIGFAVLLCSVLTVCFAFKRRRV